MNSNDLNETSVYLPYEKPISTWNKLCEDLNEVERDFLKIYLGRPLISRYEQIESEIDNLLEIWREYRNETIANCNDCSLPKLAEPPALRKRLTSEIAFFIKHIHEQCANNDQILNRRLSIGHNWNAINYAIVTGSGDEERRIRERPVSARDRSGRETPTLIIPRPMSNMDDRPTSPLISPRTPSSSNVDAQTIRKKFLSFKLEDVVDELKRAIDDDISTLEEHVRYLHQKLDEEADYRAKTRGLLKEPTLGELKEERNRLEREVFQTSNNRQIEVGSVKNEEDRSRRSSLNSMNSMTSPRSSTETTCSTPKRVNGPLRALPADPNFQAKPSLSIDRKLSKSSLSNNSAVLVRFSSTKTDDSLKKFQTATRTNSAEKFRQMVLDCRDVTS